MPTKVTCLFPPGSVRLLGIGGLLVISATWVPAIGQDVPAHAPPLEIRSDVELQDAIELANSLVGIKRAESAIAGAQEKLAKVRKELLVAQIATARVPVTTAEKEQRRLRNLPASEQRLPEVQEKLNATEAALAAANALLEEAKVKASIGDAEVGLETARFTLAKAVLADVTLRHKQLQTRAKASETPSSPNKAVNPSGGSAGS